LRAGLTATASSSHSEPACSALVAVAAASTDHQQQRPSPKADSDATPPSIQSPPVSSSMPTARLVSSNSAWKSFDGNATYDQVPDSLQQRLQSLFGSLLAPVRTGHSMWRICLAKTRTTATEKEWQYIFGHTTQTTGCKQPDGSTLLRADTVLPPYLPLGTCKMQMETTVHCGHQFHVYNPHTFLEMFAYHAVWPMVAWEFTICSHWQVVHKFKNGGDDGGGNTADTTQQPHREW